LLQASLPTYRTPAISWVGRQRVNGSRWICAREESENKITHKTPANTRDLLSRA